MTDQLEEWRPVLSGDYEVSDLGRVRRARPGRRTHAGRLMTPVLLPIGYYAVGPTVAGRNRQTYVHALVAEAFLGPRPDGASINHIDGDKTNNRRANLEYVTHAENMGHASRSGLMAHGSKHYAAKLTEDLVRDIRRENATGTSMGALARKHGIAVGQIHAIVHRRAWRHVP